MRFFSPQRLIWVGLGFIIFFLYFFRLDSVPQAFSNDEVIFGYNAYSLLQTGRDEYGKIFPIISESNGDYKLLLFSYWLVPFIRILGLNEFAVRLGQAIAATLSLTLIYFLIKRITANIKLSLLSIFVLAISPWFIVFARSGSEVMVTLLLFYLYVYMLLIWWEKQNLSFLLLSIFLALFTAIGYYSVWSVLGVSLIFVLGKVLVSKKRLIEKSVSLSLVPLPLIVILLAISASGGARMKQINLFQNSEAQPLLEEKIREDQNTLFPWMTRMYHNKLVFYPFFAARQMVETFDLEFLFFSGDGGGTMYVVPDSGVLHLWYLPFLLIGFYYLFKKSDIRYKWGILLILLTVFGAGSMSVYGSESQRTILAGPPLSFVVGYGLFNFAKNFKTHKFFSVALTGFELVVLYMFSVFLHQYFYHADMHRPWYRNFGDKQMVEVVNRFKKDYATIVAPEQTYSAFYFYNKVDPAVAQADSLKRQNIKNALGHLIRQRADGIYMMPLDCPYAGKTGVLYICRGDKVAANTRVLEVIRFADGVPAWILVEFMDPKDFVTRAQIERVGILETTDKNPRIIPQNSQLLWRNLE
jgi:4-amino-4-deoxy-L-arabinose transferase-like glycosyltransferase